MAVKKLYYILCGTGTAQAQSTNGARLIIEMGKKKIH